MYRPSLLLIASLALVAAAPVAAPRTYALKGATGAAIGQVTLTDAPKGVLLHVEAHGLTPGWHAVHFHEKADCSDAMFKSAGGHVHMMAPTVHGLLNSEANDLGDLPNLFIGADGSGAAEIFSPFVSLQAGTARANLLDADGSALVIHAMPDDYMTQPIGGAGTRVACGEIR
ncbi:superoxide dismutase [Sphingomonas sp. Root710]|uniref:superoxide dismutase[Cu-Zn] n=1 Tax=Sphingomonas sp. Root710 TaxID=1736594 RepID=UPI0006FD0AE6|nr:superoxide dismutase family protein [Sphingomonas sp. Root710]KRB85666.1 superoxide dismutase [Sphingomonas sp. Root710]